MSKVKADYKYIRANSRLLARMLTMAKVNKMDMKVVLTYSLCPSPSLSNYDGTLSKANKAALAEYLENLSTSCIVPLDQTIGAPVLVDGMAYIQQMHGFGSTFGEFASMLLKQLATICRKNDTTRIDFVTDCYPRISIKNAERMRS